MYIANLVSSAFSTIFVLFAVASLGYLVGRIEIKGISLGTAGVLLVALVYGILANTVPFFTLGEVQINLFNDAIKSSYSLVSNLGTAMFVSAVGLIAGPKFFRTFKKETVSYLLLGVIVISAGALATVLFLLIDRQMDVSMAVGLMAGALTSTPGLSAAKEVAAANSDMATAGYSIAYLFGVMGVVIFVQVVPRLLKVDLEAERKNYVAANAVALRPIERKLIQLDPLAFFPFFLTIALGCIIGAVTIPGLNFSLGTSGGTLAAGLIIGHFGHIGPIDCRLEKSTLNFYRELGLVFFLIGAGVPGGVNFISNVRWSFFLYGAVITLAPMLIGYFAAKYLFRLNLFNNLGAITGGMTSTPALGVLIATAGTDEVASAYAAAYPVALFAVVIAVKVLVMCF